MKRHEKSIWECFEGCGTMEALRSATMISKEEQDELLAQVAAHTPGAAHALALGTVRLAMSEASRYSRIAQLRSILDYDDLVMYGFEGLLYAAKKFDVSKVGEVSFTTYAIHWVRQSITRGIESSSFCVRLPVHVVSLIEQLYKTSAQAGADTGSFGDVLELLDSEEAQSLVKSDLNIRRSAFAIRTALGMTSALSLQSPVGEDGDTVLSDFIASLEEPFEDAVSAEPLDRNIRVAVASLPYQQFEVISRRFGFEPYKEEQTLQEIADDLGLSRERIRQIEACALRNLRSPRITRMICPAERRDELRSRAE